MYVCAYVCINVCVCVCMNVCVCVCVYQDLIITIPDVQGQASRNNQKNTLCLLVIYFPAEHGVRLGVFRQAPFCCFCWGLHSHKERPAVLVSQAPFLTKLGHSASSPTLIRGSTGQAAVRCGVATHCV